MGYALKKRDEAHSCCRFFVGRTMDGNWIVCDRERLVGGLFTDRQSALHFAASESQHIPGAVWCANNEDCLIADPWADIAPVPQEKSSRGQKSAIAQRWPKYIAPVYGKRA